MVLTPTQTLATNNNEGNKPTPAAAGQQQANDADQQPPVPTASAQPHKPAPHKPKRADDPREALLADPKDRPYTVNFTEKDEARMRNLRSKYTEVDCIVLDENGEQDELDELERRYNAFLNEGVERLSRQAKRATAARDDDDDEEPSIIATAVAAPVAVPPTPQTPKPSAQEDHVVVNFSRADEHRLMLLRAKFLDNQKEANEEVKETKEGEEEKAERAELADLEKRYAVFLDEGEKRLRTVAEQKDTHNEDEDPSINGFDHAASVAGTVTSVASSVASTVASSATHVAKGAMWWGSLVGTFVPGYVGRGVGATEGFEHWNWISSHLVLGALPVVSQVGQSGNHLVKLKAQCDARKTKVGLVVSCIEPQEFGGFGVNLIHFATPKDWQETLGVEKIIQLPIVDGYATPSCATAVEGKDEAETAAVAKKQKSVHADPEAATAEPGKPSSTSTTSTINSSMYERVLHTVQTIQDTMEKGEVAFVHCKAGKGRSWMVVMCHLLTHADLPYDTAETMVKLQRHQVHPSAVQVQFAKDFAAKWKADREARRLLQLEEEQRLCDVATGAVKAKTTNEDKSQTTKEEEANEDVGGASPTAWSRLSSVTSSPPAADDGEEAVGKKPEDGEK